MTTLTDAAMYGEPKTDLEAIARVRRLLYSASRFIEAADGDLHRARAALSAQEHLNGRPDLDDRVMRLQLALARCMAEAQAIDPRQPPSASPEVTQ